jgi:hypothetical protein
LLHGRYPASQLILAPPTPGAPRLSSVSCPYVFGQELGSTQTPGLPSPQTILSTRAVSNHPGRPSCSLSFGLFCSRFQTSPIREGWPPATLCNEAESSSLALRLASSPREASTAGSPSVLPLRQLHIERAIHMAGSFHPARHGRCLAHPNPPRGDFKISRSTPRDAHEVLAENCGSRPP